MTSELERRLSETTGGSRELDAMLWIECGPDHPDFTRYGWAEGWTGTYVADDRLDGYVRQMPVGSDGKRGIGQASRPSPLFTSSIDAALALVSRKLPDHKWGIHELQPGLYRAHVTKRSLLRPMPNVADAPTAPLAICLALVRALATNPQPEKEPTNG